VLMCRVKDSAIDLYNALFETTGIDEALTDYGLLVVRRVLAGKRHDDLFGENREAIAEELMRQAEDKAAEWGVEILSFELSDCRPNDETARLIQTSAQASFKLNALTAAAKRLGIADVSALDPGLASVLIGAPLVAATSVSVADARARQARVAAPDEPDSEE
jgi:regulator of protease activity HflC (stomatin/prohibitin superfamily)